MPKTVTDGIPPCPSAKAKEIGNHYRTVTLFARLRG